MLCGVCVCVAQQELASSSTSSNERRSVVGGTMAETDFGQTDFGHPYLTDFGQSDLGKTDFGQTNLTDFGQP